MDDKNYEAKTPNDGKGKGKDTFDEGVTSITERLQASTRLAMSAVAGGPDLAARQTAEKGAPSFGSIDKSSSVAGEASSSRLQSSTSSGPGQSIRTQPSLESSSAFQAFSDFIRAEPSLAFEHQQHHHHHQQLHPSGPSVSEQERLDGAEVVGLLDGPSDELDAVLPGAHDELEDDDGLDPATVAKLRVALFDSSHSESRWDDMLNFTPDFLRQPDASAEDTLLHLGTSDPEEARRIWLYQWSDVLSSYTDQVWGDLGPLAEDARKEVEEELKSDEAIADRPSQTKSLDRLRQILAHVRGH